MVSSSPTTKKGFINMRRITKVLLLSLFAALALGLVACGGGVSDHEVQKAEKSYATMMKFVEKACVAAEEDSPKLSALRRAYAVSRSRFYNAREDTYDGGNDEASGLPSKDTEVTFEEAAQDVCPDTFKIPSDEEK